MAVKDEKSIKCNVAFDVDSKWDGIDKKSSFDVVSFTFTSPIKKHGGSNSSAAMLEATSSSSPSYDPSTRESDLRNSAASSSGFSVTDGDALSVLFEQKLKELTSRVEFSQKDVSASNSLSSSVNNYGNMDPAVNLAESMDNGVCESEREAQDGSACASTEKLWLRADKSSKVSEINEGVVDSNDIRRYLHLQGISDTASSLSFGTMSETVSSTLHTKDSPNWEVKYIEDILRHTELLLEDFSLGQAHKVVAPDLFLQLENQRMESYEENVLVRKVLFDCVCEFVESKCGRVLSGGFEYWGKQMGVLERREWMVDDLYREIWRWRNGEELMVDEVVERDMSSKSGKWVDFEVEGFQGGVEIGNSILTCLLDELIQHFFF